MDEIFAGNVREAEWMASLAVDKNRGDAVIWDAKPELTHHS
jgi:hypothetical protein